MTQFPCESKEFQNKNKNAKINEYINKLLKTNAHKYDVEHNTAVTCTYILQSDVKINVDKLT